MLLHLPKQTNKQLEFNLVRKRGLQNPYLNMTGCQNRIPFPLYSHPQGCQNSSAHPSIKTFNILVLQRPCNINYTNLVLNLYKIPCNYWSTELFSCGGAVLFHMKKGKYLFWKQDQSSVTLNSHNTHLIHFRLWRHQVQVLQKYSIVFWRLNWAVLLRAQTRELQSEPTPVPPIDNYRASLRSKCH